MIIRQRPCNVELTRSRQLPADKLRRVNLVLTRITAWEHGMLLATFSIIQFKVTLFLNPMVTSLI